MEDRCSSLSVFGSLHRLHKLDPSSRFLEISETEERGGGKGVISVAVSALMLPDSTVLTASAEVWGLARVALRPPITWLTVRKKKKGKGQNYSFVKQGYRTEPLSFPTKFGKKARLTSLVLSALLRCLFRRRLYRRNIHRLAKQLYLCFLSPPIASTYHGTTTVIPRAPGGVTPSSPSVARGHSIHASTSTRVNWEQK